MKPIRTEIDNRTIDMRNDYDARYWTKEFGLQRDALQRVIDKVGPRIDAIRAELGIHQRQP